MKTISYVSAGERENSGGQDAAELIGRDTLVAGMREVTSLGGGYFVSDARNAVALLRAQTVQQRDHVTRTEDLMRKKEDLMSEDATRKKREGSKSEDAMKMKEDVGNQSETCQISAWSLSAV